MLLNVNNIILFYDVNKSLFYDVSIIIINIIEQALSYWVSNSQN